MLRWEPIIKPDDDENLKTNKRLKLSQKRMFALFFNILVFNTGSKYLQHTTRLKTHWLMSRLGRRRWNTQKFLLAAQWLELYVVIALVSKDNTNKNEKKKIQKNTSGRRILIFLKQESLRKDTIRRINAHQQKCTSKHGLGNSICLHWAENRRKMLLNLKWMTVCNYYKAPDQTTTKAVCLLCSVSSSGKKGKKNPFPDKPGVWQHNRPTALGNDCDGS